jgi:nucleoid DNA-binding protein
MLGKNDLVREIETRTGIKPNLTKRVLDSLAEICLDEIRAGEDFKVPGVATVKFDYKKAFKKGERYGVGDEVTGPQGTRIAEEPSKATAERFRVKAAPEPIIKRTVKGINKGTRAYKNVVARKSK